MARFLVTITETLEKVVEVEASTRVAACDKVVKDYYDGEYILDADDFTGAVFSVEKIEKEND